MRKLLALVAALGGPPIETLDPPAARAVLLASVERLDLPAGDLATVRDLAVPGPAGPIPARLLDTRPLGGGSGGGSGGAVAAARGPGPVVVWFHGGGFVTGSLATHHGLAAEVARRLDLPVVLAGYRLAPEAAYPAAPDDAEAVARWVAAAPVALGLDVDGVVLAGDSAGGTLAIVTAMALRDRPAAVPVLAHLALYPSTDESRTYPSAVEFAEGLVLTAAARRWYRDHYRPVVDEVRASPLLGDLAGLPPAVVLTAGLDPVRDQGRAYAAALATAGVPTVFQEAAGCVHAFALLRRAIPSVRADIDAALAALSAILAAHGGVRRGR